MNAVVQRAGVDTWSPAWYVTPDSSAGMLLDAMATVRSARGDLLPEPIAGHRVGWIKGAGMLYAEGHPSPDGLASPDALPGAFRRLVRAMEEAGVPLPAGAARDVWLPDEHSYASGVRCDGFQGVRRLDSTVDVRMHRGVDGLAVLGAVAALYERFAPGATDTWRRKGQVQTVYLRGHGGGRVLGRWYDKGVENAQHRPGELIRPEDQRRFDKGTRRDVPELSVPWVRGKFKQRFATLWKASKGVTVAGPVVVAEKIIEAIEAGDITAAQGNAIAGHVLLTTARERGAGQSRATYYRHEGKLRELGLVLARDGLMEEVEVDVGELLEEIIETDAWERRG